MPVDGRLRSRRPITGRSLGTVGLVEGTIIDLDDLFSNAPPGGSGKLTNLIDTTVTLKASDNIDTDIALV